jgi:hypothetical protein
VVAAVDTAVDTARQVFDVVGRAIPAGVTWLWAKGDLDRGNVRAARGELAELFRDGTCPRWLSVYLGNECFVDLRGLELLIEVAERVWRGGGELVVVAPPYGLQRMVELLGPGFAVPMVATVPDALRLIRCGAVGIAPLPATSNSCTPGEDR